MHMNDFKISWVALLGSLTKPSKAERPALRPPRYYGRLVITTKVLATRQNGHTFSRKKEKKP